MLKRRDETRKLLLWIAGLCAATFTAGAASAAQDVMLTAVAGDAKVEDQLLSGRGEVGDEQRLETGDDGSVSVLLDRSAVVELCGQTQVSFRRDSQKGNRIVNIDSGEVRFVVEPREPGERIEIHTPTAIATILGTVVYVSVDPVTGATTISSSQSQVNIKGKDEMEKEGTTIDAFEQLTVMPGKTGDERQKKKISKKDIDELGNCLLDFHDLAVEVDRIPQEGKTTQRVVNMDVATADLPPIETGPPIVEPEDPGAEVEPDVLDPFDDPGQMPDPEPEEPMMEIPNPFEELDEANCGLVPCDHGNFP